MQDFIPRLKQALQQPLPGFEAQSRLAHPARKRLHDPADNAKKAAVLALFFPKNSDWHLVFIQRTTHEKDRHGGQISFPGGRYEPEDQDFQVTALRETEEEVGIAANTIQVLGDLSNLYIPVSNFLVQPYVGYIDYTPEFRPDPGEVAQVLELPFSAFLEERVIRTTHVRLPNQFLLKDVPHFNVNNHVIWGATGMMMCELVAVASKASARPQ